MVGQLNDGLVFGFITDLRSAKNDFDVRPDAFDGGYNFDRGRDVPDVNAEADEFRIAREEDFRDVERTLIDVELHEARARPERAEIGQQVAQAERGMDVFRSEERRVGK